MDVEKIELDDLDENIISALQGEPLSDAEGPSYQKPVFCISCGESLTSRFEYCPNCGRKIEDKYYVNKM